MIEPTEQEQRLERAGMTQAVVRQITAAFRQVEDFDPFVRGIESALGRIEFFDRAAISLYPQVQENGEEKTPFPGGTLCLPLAGQERVHGLVGFSRESRPFGAEDLHLMAALGDLVGVLVDHAMRFGDQRRNLALLGFLLDQAPVGAACFDRERNILVSNTHGRRLLGVRAGDGRPWVLPEEWAKEAELAAAEGGVFHRRIAGQLLHVQVKHASSEFGEGLTALVLADLTPEQDRFREAVERETYRCSWLGRPVSLAMITAAQAGELMNALRLLRERLPAGAVVGPCDSDAIGILFPETIFSEAMEHVRGVRSFLKDDWQLGVATIEEREGNPEVLVASAAAARRRVGDSIRHSLLLHDDYASVNDMLELVLRDEFRVIKSSDLEVTMKHLRTGRFDGFFSEIDLSHGASVVDLVRVGRQHNPNIRSFLTSCAAGARRQNPLFRQETIFQKPFNVRDVLNGVKEAFALSGKNG